MARKRPPPPSPPRDDDEELEEEIELDEDERAALKEAVRLVKGGLTAAQLSELIHEHSRSWQDAKNGEILDIYLDILSDDEFEENREALAKSRRLVEGVLE